MGAPNSLNNSKRYKASDFALRENGTDFTRYCTVSPRTNDTNHVQRGVEVNVSENKSPGAQAGATEAKSSLRKTTPEEYSDHHVQASTPVQDWENERWNWKRAVRKDSRLSDGAKLLAATLCDDFANRKTALCRHPVEQYAEALGKSSRAIQRALAELRKHGWIATPEVRGRGRPSDILFLRGDGAVRLEQSKTPPQRHQNPASNTQEKATELSPFKQSQPPKRVTDVTRKGDRSVTPYNNVKPKKNQRTRKTENFGDPRQLHQRHLVEIGSHQAISWQEWLDRSGLGGTLEELVPTVFSNGTEGFDLCARIPPADDDKIGGRIALRYFQFLHRTHIPEA